MKANVFCDELCDDFVKGIPIARQVIIQDVDVARDISEQIKRHVDSLGRNFRMIAVDAKQTRSYGEMVKNILNSSFTDTKFDKEDTMVVLGDFAHCADEGELDFQVQCMLSDYATNGIYTLLVIENYESVMSAWKSKDYGNMRALISSCDKLSVLILSDRSAYEVSEEPAGSSPFFNIFDEPVRVD